jgi:DinB superfamily
MGPKDVIRNGMDTSDFVIKSYINDLSDEDLRLVPVPGMHPIALQLGHLITGERMFQEMIEPGSAPPLPEGFAEAHDIKQADGDPARFKSREEYIKLWDEQRAGVKALLDRIGEAELDDTRDGKLPPWAPTVAVVLNTVGTHALMHAGQFVAVRRQLNKPIAF